MSTHDTALDESDESDEVTVRCLEGRAVRVRFFDRSREDAGCVYYAVEVSAPSLDARVDGVAAWKWNGDLVAFLEGLAQDFRGWEGERVWQSSGRDLTVRAIVRSGGHVGLTWTLRPWRTSVGSWSASVTTWMEAGEQMSVLAADVRHFLRQ